MGEPQARPLLCSVRPALRGEALKPVRSPWRTKYTKGGWRIFTGAPVPWAPLGFKLLFFPPSICSFR